MTACSVRPTVHDDITIIPSSSAASMSRRASSASWCCWFFWVAAAVTTLLLIMSWARLWSCSCISRLIGTRWLNDMTDKITCHTGLYHAHSTTWHTSNHLSHWSLSYPTTLSSLITQAVSQVYTLCICTLHFFKISIPPWTTLTDTQGQQKSLWVSQPNLYCNGWPIQSNPKVAGLYAKTAKWVHVPSPGLPAAG